jgi:hypothetical protein
VSVKLACREPPIYSRGDRQRYPDGLVSSSPGRRCAKTRTSGSLSNKRRTVSAERAQWSASSAGVKSLSKPCSWTCSVAWTLGTASRRPSAGCVV